MIDAAETLRRMRRTCEMSAAIMRDPERTGSWVGAEKVARQFDRLADQVAEVASGLVEAVIAERESCAFAVECHSGFGDPATIEACAQIVRDRGGCIDDPVHVTREAYARLRLDAAMSVGPSVALQDIAAERYRHVEKHGWAPQHDDEHQDGELGRAALNYLAAASITTALQGKSFDPGTSPPLDSMGIAFDWPWARSLWKPGLVRRMLVKAGALIVAEIERLDRAAAITAEVPKRGAV